MSLSSSLISFTHLIRGVRYGCEDNFQICMVLQWYPAITKCHGTQKIVRYRRRPRVITNYLVNSKNIRYSGVPKLNQAEQWDIYHAKQSTDLRETFTFKATL